ncbi:MAG: dUTP diphosphatase [Candidatus Nitronauta litoralis]|uniref:dUTP diphosphatase n=1 Tax=Candidatus Nitronauta litoralis TaxID=2705533 RepID=A0A7T0G086_9BACT|nr:MAG: dUTP diphosphatase [Candidatus Nitronauta litoralis]
MTDYDCPVQGEVLPEYAQPEDAGADLRSSVDDVLPPRSRKLISTGISIALPEGFVGLVWPRSGLAVKKGIDSGAGVIDSGYRGEIKVLLFNHSDEAFPIKKGDRIAQLLVQKVERVLFRKVDKLPDSERGTGGFGSTGQ